MNDNGTYHSCVARYKTGVYDCFLKCHECFYVCNGAV